MSAIYSVIGQSAERFHYRSFHESETSDFQAITSFWGQGAALSYDEGLPVAGTLDNFVRLSRYTFDGVHWVTRFEKFAGWSVELAELLAVEVPGLDDLNSIVPLSQELALAASGETPLAPNTWFDGIGDERYSFVGPDLADVHGTHADELHVLFADDVRFYGYRGADRLVLHGDGSTVWMGGGNDSAQGSDGDDTIRGQWGNDWLHAQQGNDNVQGGWGHDTIDGGDGDDTLHGGRGNDSIFAGDGNDRVVGAAGNDRLRTHDGNDTVLGDQGSDTIYGGGGNDMLRGGAGADFFQFDVLTNRFADDISPFREVERGRDVVWDFDASVDHINLVMNDQYAIEPEQAFAIFSMFARQAGDHVEFAMDGLEFVLMNTQLEMLTSNHFDAVNTYSTGRDLSDWEIFL